MRKCLKKRKKALVCLKIIAITAVLIIVAALSHRQVYYMYACKMEERYPWISGGTVVTFSKASDTTLALRVSLRTGVFPAPDYLPTQYAHRWWDDISIAKRGEMRHYYYDHFSALKSLVRPSQWNGLLEQTRRPRITRMVVVIDTGVTSIGYCAFYRTPLNRFYDYNQGLLDPVLESLVIANSVEYIGESAFYGCGSLPSLTIPDGVKWIGRRAFYDCNILSPVTIPKSVEYIGEEAFEGTVHIDVAADNPNYTSIDGVLFNKNKTETKER